MGETCLLPMRHPAYGTGGHKKLSNVTLEGLFAYYRRSVGKWGRALISDYNLTQLY